uniref:RGS domain-containing protein n=1 Tax=Steinernema glaseri TaxID=37863 RepID=A0A1I7YWK0_9BILA
MIRNDDGRSAFTEFLKSEYSDENIMFWWAVQQLRSSNADGTEFAHQVRQMYDLYIAADSPHAINIDHDTRTEIIERVEGSQEPFPEDIYDRAQTHVYRLMEKDCFSRFVHTPTYKELAKKLHLPQSFRFCGRNSPI